MYHRIKVLKRSRRSVALLVLLNASRHRQHRLTLFLAIKKKEYLVRGLGLHKPQYISIFHINNKINIITLQKSYYPFSLSVQNPVLIEFLPNLFSILSIHSASFLSFSDTESNKNNCSESL